MLLQLINTMIHKIFLTDGEKTTFLCYNKML